MKRKRVSAHLMRVVVDDEGRILAALEPSADTKRGVQCDFEPLPGQSVCSARVPASIASIRSGHDLHVAFSTATIDPKTGAFITGREIKSSKD
jgi:hypothetical protein